MCTTQTHNSLQYMLQMFLTLQHVNQFSCKEKVSTVILKQTSVRHPHDTHCCQCWQTPKQGYQSHQRRAMHKLQGVT